MGLNRALLLVGESPFCRAAIVRPMHALSVMIPQGRINGPDQVRQRGAALSGGLSIGCPFA
jgi:hypothetical protein